MKYSQLLKVPFLLFPLSVGCASLIGLSERTFEDADSGGEPNGTGGAANPNEVVDVETGRTTTKLCVKYCDTVEKNCPVGTEFQQYNARPDCIDVCNALPEGDTEPTGNSVNCRLSKANGAANAPDEFCKSAGPAGEGSCGSNCEAWCYILESACPDEFNRMEDCQASCQGLTDDTNDKMFASTPDAPNLQCRIYHLTVALSNPTTHCGHGAYVSTLHCGDVGDTPNCETYCDRIMANCPPTDEVKTNSAVYESQAECVAACGAFPVGTLADRKENTLGCHFYHANLATGGRAPHCAHAGPSGEGACLADMVDDEGVLTSSQNCDSYCALYKKGCEADFDAKYDSPEACMSDCVTTFATTGARSNTKAVQAPGSPFFYVAATAPLTDTLQCRIYRAVKAVAGDEDACALAATDSDCVE
jgi:hypothetical protein